MLRDPGLIPLSHDHQRALALCVLSDRALAAGQPARTVAARIVEQYEVEILDHFRFEERILFPAVERFSALRDLVAELIAEHRRLESLAAALQSTPDHDAVLEFTALLRTHVRREEQVLFEQAQRLLSRSELDALRSQRAPQGRQCAVRAQATKFTS